MNALSPAVTSLLKRAVREPERFGALHRGHLEAAAVLFQVHPFVVDELRTALTRPEVRARVARLLSRSRRRQRKAVAVKVQARPVSATAASLLAAVHQRPHGPELLMHAPVETVATLFGVHAFVVDEARAALQRQRTAAAFTPAPRPSAPFFMPLAEA